MKGYIVGYFGDWADDRNPIIIGYYTTWNLALEVTKKLERENIDYHGGLQEVYLVEVEVNKTYPITNPILDWINNYINYRVRTRAGKTALESNKGRMFEIELPEPEPIVRVSELRSVRSSSDIQKAPESEQDWTRAGSRKSHQQRPRKGKRLSQKPDGSKPTSGNATQN